MDVENNPNSLMLCHGKTRILLSSPTGASHIDRNEFCQDACLASQRFYKGRGYTTLSIADGHGSDVYTRSEIGSHLAMEAAQYVTNKFIMLTSEYLDTNSLQWRRSASQDFSSRFSKWLWISWRKLVIQHAEENSESDLDPSSEESIRRYGTTIAVVIIFNKTIFAGMIGDSAIYGVEQKDIEVLTSHVLEQDENTLGLGTASLCSKNSHYNWESKVLRLDDFDMLFITTDGFVDSLDKPELSVTDIYYKTKIHGINWLKSVLPNQLSQWSESGVGDDMASIAVFPNLLESDSV